MYEYMTILDCMIFTSYNDLPKTISLDVNVGSEENLDIKELIVFATRECEIECERREIDFYGFRIMRVHRFKLDKTDLSYKPL